MIMPKVKTLVKIKDVKELRPGIVLDQVYVSNLAGNPFRAELKTRTTHELKIYYPGEKIGTLHLKDIDLVSANDIMQAAMMEYLGMDNTEYSYKMFYWYKQMVDNSSPVSPMFDWPNGPEDDIIDKINYWIDRALNYLKDVYNGRR